MILGFRDMVNGHWAFPCQSLEVWARTEGDLHRALMSHVLLRSNKNKDARLGWPLFK